MRVPKKISAFGRSYDIIHDDEVTDQFDSYGLVHHGEEVVFLQKRSKKYSEQREAATLLHEIIHIIEENLRMELDESQVGLLSTSLYGVIKENKLCFLDVPKK